MWWMQVEEAVRTNRCWCLGSGPLRQARRRINTIFDFDAVLQSREGFFPDQRSIFDLLVTTVPPPSRCSFTGF